MNRPVMKPGHRNSITDIPGLRVGNAQDEALKSGVTVLTADCPFTTGVSILGGAPGTREIALLAPDKTVRKVDALVLSGGSVFGLDAASGVVDGLREAGRGLLVGTARIPIVPAAILFDLLNGGDRNRGRYPYAELGRRALANCTDAFEIGSIGAGTGATTATLKGGLGTASAILPSGHTVGALVAVNALGSAIAGDGPQFWAAPWELNAEFGGAGGCLQAEPGAMPPVKSATTLNTTIAIVATDATLDQAQCTRLATAAHDGIARALAPSHTPMDGDLVFALGAGQRAARNPDDPGDPGDLLWIGHVAAICLARAIARGVHAATPAPGDILPCWSDRFGK